MLGQRPGRDVRERHVLGDRAQARTHRDPHLLQRLGGAVVDDVLGALAAHRRERSLDRADDVGDRDLARRPVEPVAALGAALAADETGVAHVAEDVLEELQRDALRLGERLALRRLSGLGGGELHRRADRVVDLRRDAHGARFSRTRARHHVAVPAMMPLEVETPRLVGRPPRADDVPALLALHGDPVVAARLYPNGSPRTEAQLSPQLDADIAHWRAPRLRRLLWAQRAPGEGVAPRR